MVTFVLLGCAPRTEEAECEVTRLPITGEIVEGKEIPVGSTVVIPHKVAVLVHTTVPIVEVRVGNVPAQLTSVGQQRWEAQLFTNDLEAKRQGDTARLDVTALDRCGTEVTLDTASIALGPAPGIAVQDLTLSEIHAPAECYLPSGGSASALVQVSAHPASAGAKVTLHASMGSFDNAAGTVELVLQNTGGNASTQSFFVPDKAGAVTITASAKGASATPLIIPIADPPVFTAPTTALARGVGYTATVSTVGNLDSCLTEEVIAGASTVTLLEPDLGVLNGSVSVREVPMSCTAMERVRFEVRFGAAALDGSAVTLRCFDTFGRGTSVTFAVQPLPLSPSP
ncbi:MAG TPA: hypothetical protein VNO30_50105 [Kofleriaceae bacterium]|nr:hypothetical protein [Kofleriaceae bacterium]